MTIEKSINQAWLYNFLEKYKAYFNSGELGFIELSSEEIIILIEKKWNGKKEIEESVDAFIEWLRADAIDEISSYGKGRTTSDMPKVGMP